MKTTYSVKENLVLKPSKLLEISTNGAKGKVFEKFESHTSRSKKSIETEYFTVKYEFTITRKIKRLLLQTYLDSLLRREKVEITFADFLILEDLYARIREDMSEQDYRLKFKDFDVQLLYITELFLKFCPANSQLFTRQGKEDFFEWIVGISEACLFFEFSNDRTYGSRIRTYYPGKFINITVEVPFQNNSRFSERYDSYCKGHPTPGAKGQRPLPTEIQPNYDLDGQIEISHPNHFLVDLLVRSTTSLTQDEWLE